MNSQITPPCSLFPNPKCSNAPYLWAEKPQCVSVMGQRQPNFERRAYLSPLLSDLLSILGAKENFSQEKIPPATALLSCSVIQSFQVSKPSPLLTPLRQRRKTPARGPSPFPQSALQEDPRQEMWQVRCFPGQVTGPTSMSLSSGEINLQHSHLALKICPASHHEAPNLAARK